MSERSLNLTGDEFLAMWELTSQCVASGDKLDTIASLRAKLRPLVEEAKQEAAEPQE